MKLSTMQKYESGAILNLKVDTIRKICTIFEIPTSILIFPESAVIPLKPGLKIKNIYNVNQMIDSSRAFLSLNDIGRKKAVDYMNDLLEIEKYKGEFF